MSQLKEKISHFIHEDPLFRRLLKNTGYMFSASTLSIVFVAVQSILSARLLGKDGFGLISIVITFVTTINTVFSFRMGDFVVRYFSAAKAEGNMEKASAVIKASTIAESITSVIAFLFLIVITPLSSKLLSKIYTPSYMQSLILLFSMVILANITTETANGILRVTNHYKTQAAINLIQTIVTFSMITLAFIFKWGLGVVLWAYLLGKVLIGVGPIIMAYRTMRREFGKDWWSSRLSLLPPFKEMASFALSTNFSATIKQFASESEPLWLALFFNEGAAGLYKVALAIVNLLTIPITPFIQTAYPEITDRVVSHKWDSLRKLLRRITLLAAIWTVPAGLFMTIFGQWIIVLFYKGDYLPAYPSMMILILGFGISNIFFWNRSLLLGFGKANVALYILAVAGILKVGLAFLILPQSGIIGEAGLLSGYLIFSSMVMVLIGYQTIQKGESRELNFRGNMKIAYIATSSIPSSTANSIQVMKVCQALTQLGHEAHLLIPGRGDLNWDELTHQYGLSTQFPITHIASIKAFRRFDFIFSALDQSKTLKVDAVYTRMLWVAVIAQLRHVPVILELHDIPAGRLGKPLFMRYLGSDSKNLTVLITRALGKVIEKRFGLTISEKTQVIAPDGVDEARYQSLPEPTEARKQLGINENLTAVYTGGFYKGRGLELLVELAKAFPQVQFLWVGGKPEAVAGWKTVIDNLKIENIQLTGFIPNEKLPLYQAAGEILLMPFGKSVSGSSGGNTAEVCSPLKMFEYMAAGRSILTSDLPVLREVLNEKNALFYAIEDFEDLKAKFTLLVNDTGLRIQLASQAKVDVAQYAWRERMHKIIKRFNEV